MAFVDEIVGRARLIRERFQNLNPADKRRLALIGTAILSVLLIISVLASLPKRNREKNPGKTDNEAVLSPIPADELFLPEEPDFIPGVMLERDRRAGWTEEDAAEYWQDPLKYGEEQWREKIEKTIDEFLERVP